MSSGGSRRFTTRAGARLNMSVSVLVRSRPTTQGSPHLSCSSHSVSQVNWQRA